MLTRLARAAQSQTNPMAALVTPDHLLIVIFSLPCHLWHTARRCLHPHPSGHLRMPARTRRANMPINYQMEDCMTIYTGTPLHMQRTHPMAIAMNPPAAARIRLATTGATNTILHQPYGHIPHLTGLIEVLQDLLTSIPRITKPFSRACRGLLLLVLRQ